MITLYADAVRYRLEFLRACLEPSTFDTYLVIAIYGIRYMLPSTSRLFGFEDGRLEIPCAAAACYMLPEGCSKTSFGV